MENEKRVVLQEYDEVFHLFMYFLLFDRHLL